MILHSTVIRVVVVAILFPAGAVAQKQLTPWPSPAATTSLTVGTTTLAIAYHRPAVKGRDLAAELPAAGPVWRLGANEATTLKVSDDVTIGGTGGDAAKARKNLAAGTYALFASIKGDTWTLILNEQAQQWGSYFYDEKKDVLRFDVKAEAAATSAEWMTFTIDPVGAEDARVAFHWGKIRWSFPIHVDVARLVEYNLDSALHARKPGDVNTLLSAVKYYSNRGERLPEALVWAETARVEKEDSFWAWEWKGRVLQQLGRAAEGVPCVTKAMELAKGKAPQGYLDGLQKLVDEWKKLPAK